MTASKASNLRRLYWECGAVAVVQTPMLLLMIDPTRWDLYQYYVGWFLVLLLACYVIRKQFSSSLHEEDHIAPAAAAQHPAFKELQKSYLVVFLIMMAADWVQGPYVYSLYSLYGFSKADIAMLFIAGFGCSLVFGTFVGSLADKYGRKRMCLCFGILYSLSCLTKHSPSYEVLMMGRVMGGISTSILFSAFESWIIHEHHFASYPEEWLGATFSLATSGNSLVAIAAGVAANVARDSFGPVAPFDVSLLLLVIGSVIVWLTWEENYGDQTLELQTTLKNAYVRLVEDKKIMLLGVIQSTFEGAMYIFVFMWTPALENTSAREVFHGWVFASFMICVLIGSSIFTILLRSGVRVERFSVYTFAIAAVSLTIPAFIHVHSMRFAAFCVFEVCCGLFWPSMGLMRSRYVPEEVRATIMNFFRIPLNGIVVLVLANMASLTEFQVFLACVACLLPAFFCQVTFARLSLDEGSEGPKKRRDEAFEPVSTTDHDPEDIHLDLAPTADTIAASHDEVLEHAEKALSGAGV